MDRMRWNFSNSGCLRSGRCTIHSKALHASANHERPAVRTSVTVYPRMPMN